LQSAGRPDFYIRNKKNALKCLKDGGWGHHENDYGLVKTKAVWPGQDAKASKLSMTGECGAAGADQLKGKFGNPSKPLLKATVPAEGRSPLSPVFAEKLWFP